MLFYSYIEGFQSQTNLYTTVKRGLVYEKQIFPKHCYGECVTAPEKESQIVYSFDKVTLAKGQVFRIYFYEDGGPRNFVLSFGMRDVR